jgi:hypothetical protein
VTDQQVRAYEAGAGILTQTDSQEELDRAKAGLDAPTSQTEEASSFGRVIRTASEAVDVWAYYRRDGADRSERILPDDLSNPSPMVGMEIPTQIAGFVEETEGFRMVEATLRAMFNLPWPYTRPPFGGVTYDDFMARLGDRLPYEFLPPRRELCEAEIDAIMTAAEAARMAEIDEKYRRRHPGFFS